MKEREVKEHKMKTIVENFRDFKNSISDIDVYQFSALLLVSNNSDRRKTDILSDIRAIEGVTTVSPREHRSTSHLEFTELIIKIDTTPFNKSHISHILFNIVKETNKIRGVQKFKVISKPERI